MPRGGEVFGLQAVLQSWRHPRWRSCRPNLALLLGFLVLPTSVLGLEPPDIFERWGTSVVTVLVRGTDGGGFGSGFIIPPNGSVVTNHHVVDGATDLVVLLATGEQRRVSAVLVADAERDVAVLSLDSTNLRQVVIGDSSRVRVGERVVAIGSPRGLANSVSVGNVSQVRRLGTVTVIQTTAPISSGNSGGPLFNDRGEVIGVNAFLVRDGQNLNFAIAINEVRAVLGETVARSPQAPSPVPMAVPKQSEPSRPLKYALYLWNGSVVPVEGYQEIGETIAYDRAGGAVSLPRAAVARIAHRDDGTVREITRTPPPPARADAPNTKNVDVADLLARPRSALGLPEEGQRRPAAVATPSDPECHQNPLDLSQSEPRVVTFNVLEVLHQGKTLLVEVQQLRDNPPMAEAAARRVVGEVLRSGRTLTVSPTTHTANRIKGVVCVDGRNIVHDPRLRPYAVK